MLAVVGEVRSVAIGHALESQRRVLPNEQLPSFVRQRGTELRCAIIAERHEPAVEKYIQVHGEQEAVVDIEAFRIRGVLPGLGVARAEQPGDVEAGHRATAAPVVHKQLAEEVLTDALADDRFGFSAADSAEALLESPLGQRRLLGEEDADAAE